MKHKKQALMNSVISLLLCASMLVGTTYAWFTDGVSTGINTIAAGNLDVELYHTNAAVTDEAVTGDTKLFLDLQGDPILWEPGVVSYENLRVANEGDLALAYQLAISTANENFVVDPSGAQYGLSQILKVGVVEGGITATDREAVVASVDAANWTTLANFLRNGSLLPEGEGESEKTWGIVIYWQPGENDNFWNLNNGKQLSEGEVLSIDLGVKLIATQETHESDSFGSDYDTDAKTDVFPVLDLSGAVTTPVVPGADNRLTEQVVMISGQVTATIPAGVQLAPGTNALTMSVTEMEESGANIVLDEDEAMLSLDVHIGGIDAANTVPMIIDLGEVLPTGLNIGNYTLHHVENGVTVAMTKADAVADLDAHNEFYYDPATGNVTVALATFSEVALVANEENGWNGEFDYKWYDADAKELTIANADQLAAFGAIVGGMNGQTRDTFEGQIVKLISDINIGDTISDNDLVFYPIGYYNSNGSYKRESDVSVSSTVYSFKGTFDGNGHTISNFYQNTWEMFGDYNDGYSGTPNYYKDAMGLFGYVVNGTVKNLTVDNFSSDGEFTPTGVIAAYAVNSTFENIAITNCNPRVYNTGNGGIVGIGGSESETSDPKNVGLRFENVTIDNTNTITALWGSWDVACGGLVGMFRGPNSVWMTNCHVAAQIDVYNDVCGNYQYYWYRYSGMMIGTNKNMITDKDGYTVPETSKFHAEGCTVHFGNWNDYYYCELVANSLASYTHDHQFSRLTQISSLDEIKSGDTWTKTGNFLLISGDTKTCYHIVNKDGDLKQHLHTNAGEETVNGATVLKEDKQIVYLPFNQLFTGYGWGVKHIPVYNGKDYAFEGITILDREVGNSVEKFEGKVTELANNKVYKLGDIFTFVDNGVELVPEALTVTVTSVDENNPVTAQFTRNNENWANGELILAGTGKAKISIQDYYFCTPTTIEVEVTGIDSLYRVGNQNGVSYVDIVNVLTRQEKYSTIKIAEGTYTETDGKVQFNITGVVSVVIDGVPYYLEVVDATNVTSLSGTITGNVVLLKNCGLSSLTVSGRNTVYGNGFTATYTGNGQYLNNGLKQGVVTVSENGMLDNLRIEASVYPAAYLYYSEAQKGKSDGNNRYFYQLSAVAATGNATIANCYIYGGRTNIYIGDGNVTVTDSVLECGTLANVQIVSSNAYTVTFNNLTTIQHQMNATVGDTTKSMHGAAILVGDGDKDNEDATAPTIVLNGEFKQYNWVTDADKNAVSDSNAKMIIGGALDATAFNHTVNGNIASNLGIIFLNDFDDTNTNIKNNTNLPYYKGAVSLSLAGFSVSRKVWSLQGASSDQIYSDYINADKDTGNGYYAPQFKYSADLGGQYIGKTDDGDEHCYREGDTIYVMFPSGDSRDLDLAALVNITKYSEQDLNIGITCKDENNSSVTITEGKMNLSEAGEYTVTYTVEDTLFYDENGQRVEKTVNYSWNVVISVSLKDTAIPNAYFAFDSSKQVIYRSGNSSIVQFIPFLAGLKIYDYNGQTSYLRFDGDNDFNKVAKATINNINTTGEGQGYHIVTIELVDGGKLIIDMDVRANSGSSTHSGSIKVRNNVLYVVNGGTTSGKGQTWKIYSYKFVGNNGTEINSGLITFGTAGVDCSTATKPSSNFGTTIKYTVTYDANGGNCGQTIGYATSASAAVTLPTPSCSGYIFAGWYTAASGGTRVGGAGESYTPSANITLYAQWGKPCTVTYNANGGSCGTASEKYSGTALTLPTPTRDGYWFIGWYDAAEDGNKIGDAGATYNPSGEITLYAHWQEKVEYTVTYNANGGTCSTASATYQGTALTLPTPTRTGYKFLGWYTAASGGTKIGDAGATYTPSADIALYAQWQINSYTITVTTTNATVKVNGTTVNNNGTVSVQYGDQVTVEVTYSEDNKQSTTIKGTDGTIYTSPFTMPAQDVTINATSESGGGSSCITPDTLITLADGSQVRVDSLTGDEMLLVWNLETGKYDVAPIVFVDSEEEAEYEIIHLYFSDGSDVKVIYEHGFFDLDLGKYVYIDATNYTDYIGHRFVTEGDIKSNSWKVATLDEVVIEKEVTTAWSPVTFEHLCYFTNGVLSMPGGIAGLFNIFEVDTNTMRYDMDLMIRDIETYGLFTLEDFGGMITEEAFRAFNGAYLKVAIGKGLLTWEAIAYMAERYIPLM